MTIFQRDVLEKHGAGDAGVAGESDKALFRFRLDLVAECHRVD